MKKKDILNLALIGLALGGAISGCSPSSEIELGDTPNSEKSKCPNGCPNTNKKPENQSDASSILKTKRESATEQLTK